MIPAIMLMGALQGVIISIVLFDPKRRNHAANRYLAVLMLLVSLLLINIFWYHSPLFRAIPLTLYFSFSLYYALMPFVYLYLQALTVPGFRMRGAEWAHFLLPGLAVLYSWDLWLAVFKGREAILAYGRDWRWGIWPSLAWNLAFILQTVFYLILIFIRLRRHVGRAKEAFSTLGSVSLNWIRTLAIIMTLTILLWVAIVTLILFGAGTSWIVVYRDYAAGLIMAAAVYAAGYLALRQSDLFLKEMVEAAPRRYEKSNLTPEKAETGKRMIRSLLETDRLYANEKLSLGILAKEAGMPAYHVSQIINESFGKSFFDLVNEYRIEDAKRKLLDPRNRERKILAIAFDVGFNSKAAFNRVFKKNVRLTPSEFKKRAVPDS
jgi:AraC-like DNA-binding protein